MQSVICSLQSAVCSLQMSDTELQLAQELLRSHALDSQVNNYRLDLSMGVAPLRV